MTTGELEAHLRSGREHDGELVELRATVFALDRFADEGSLEVPARPTTVTRRRALGPPWSSCSARPIRAISLGRECVTPWPQPRRSRSSQPGGSSRTAPAEERTRCSLALRGPAGQTLSLTGNSSDERVAVTMTGFQRQPSDHVYQLWAIRDDKWVRIGLCNPMPDGTGPGNSPLQFILANVSLSPSSPPAVARTLLPHHFSSRHRDRSRPSAARPHALRGTRSAAKSTVASPASLNPPRVSTSSCSSFEDTSLAGV